MWGEPEPDCPDGLQDSPGIFEPELLGDKISSALAFIGVTEERVSNWLGGPCGCSERREKLNQLHAWAKEAVSQTKEKALSFLNGLLGGNGVSS